MIIYALAKKSDAWSASLGIFDSMAARPYGLVMCCYRHRLYTTIDRLVVQFREIHDRLPTLDTNQRLNQKLVGSDQPLFLAVASGESRLIFYGSPAFFSSSANDVVRTYFIYLIFKKKKPTHIIDDIFDFRLQWYYFLIAQFSIFPQFKFSRFSLRKLPFWILVQKNTHMCWKTSLLQEYNGII